jgi:hypothetical protein
VAVQRLAAKLSHLPAAQIGIRLSLGTPAAQERILVALMMPVSEEGPARAKAPERDGASVVANQSKTPPAGTESEPLACPNVDRLLREMDELGKAVSEYDEIVGQFAEKHPEIKLPRTLTGVAPARVASNNPRGHLASASETVVEPSAPPPNQSASVQDQLRSAITSFQPALKACVQQALKREPGMHGEARIQMDIGPDGHAKLLGIHTQTLAGGEFEGCVRRVADHWNVPLSLQGHQVEIPLKVIAATTGAP